MKTRARELATELNVGNFEHINEVSKLLVKLADSLENMEQQFDLAIEFLAKCNNMTKVKNDY
jgi:hypothetical protein